MSGECHGESAERAIELGTRDLHIRAIDYRMARQPRRRRVTRLDPDGEIAGQSTPEDRNISRPDWQIDSPLLLTRAQAAQLCQVSMEILDEWSYEPGFPVIRRNGGHFVRIHRRALERWLEQFALASNPRQLRRNDPPPQSRRVRSASDR